MRRSQHLVAYCRWLFAVGAGAGVFAVLNLNYRTALLIISAALVAVAWVLFFADAEPRTSCSTCAASVLVLTAASWSLFEPIAKIVLRVDATESSLVHPTDPASLLGRSRRGRLTVNEVATYVWAAAHS